MTAARFHLSALLAACTLAGVGCAGTKTVDRSVAREVGTASRGPGGEGREAYQDALSGRGEFPPGGANIRLTPSSVLTLAYRHSREL